MPYKDKEKQKKFQRDWHQIHAKRRNQTSKEWKDANREYVREWNKAYRLIHLEEAKERAKAYENRIRAELTDKYIIKTLVKTGIPRKAFKLFPQLIEDYRQYIQSLRTIKNNKHVNKGNRGEHLK